MMRSPRLTSRIFRKSSPAFTLVELLVAMAVLLLLVVMVAQLMNSATSISTASGKRMDADADARVVFSRLLYDVDGMVLRRDIDCFFVKNSGPKNDAFYFYSHAASLNPGDPDGAVNSPIGLVGYRIANHTGVDLKLYPNQMLERVAVMLKYNDAGAWSGNSTWNMVSLTRGAPTATVPSPTPVPESTMPSVEGALIGGGPNWDNPPGYSANLYGRLSDQVFRLEFCMQLKDGTFYVPPAPGNDPAKNTPFNDAMLKVRTNVTALIVTIALLDPKSRVIATDLTKAIAALPDGDTPAVAKAWNDKITGGTFAQDAGIPVLAASQVRVYQRSFRFPTR